MPLEWRLLGCPLLSALSTDISDCFPGSCYLLLTLAYFVVIPQEVFSVSILSRPPSPADVGWLTGFLESRPVDKSPKTFSRQTLFLAETFFSPKLFSRQIFFSPKYVVGHPFLAPKQYQCEKETIALGRGLTWKA